ncbi:TPA: hypothetical protein ACF3HK_002056 [Klebsiella pneumoniae]
MTTDITELTLIKGQKVEAPYYLAECTECGKMYSSSKLIVSRNYFDGDADCYCPHCNADDADIADLGSSEQPAAMAWNYQQARIDALVEALESEKRICATWRKTAEANSEKLEKSEKTSEARREAIGRAHNMFVRERDRANAAEEALDKAQQVDEELCKLLPPGVEYMDPPDGGDVTPLEGVRRMVADYRQRIAELESRTVKLPQRHSMLLREGFNEDYHTEMAFKADEVQASLAAAGIKVETE